MPSIIITIIDDVSSRASCSNAHLRKRPSGQPPFVTSPSAPRKLLRLCSVGHVAIERHPTLPAVSLGDSPEDEVRRPCPLLWAVNRLARHQLRLPMPRKRTEEIRRRRICGSHVSGRLAALSSSTGRLPSQAVALPFADRAMESEVRSRRRINLAPGSLHHCEFALSCRKHRTFADIHGGVQHHSHRLRCEYTSRLPAGNAVERAKPGSRSASSRFASVEFLSPKIALAATRKRRLRRLMLGAVRQSLQVAIGSDRHPPQDHTESCSRRSTPSAFSGSGGNVKRDAQPPSRLFAPAAANRVAPSRRGGRWGFRLKCRPAGSRHAAHGVRLLRSGAGECLLGQRAAVVMILLSGKPLGAGNEDAGGRALSLDINIQREMTAGGKSSLLDSPSNATRGATDGAGRRRRVLLANFLLSGTCADTEPEGRYLECLNQRFGEAQLNACEVMLRDLADSRRLNAHLASGDIPHCTKGEVDVSAIVVSAQFWPTFKGGTREAADVTESARVAVGYTVKLESKNNAVEVNRTTVITQLACNAIVMRGNFSCAFDISTFYVLKCTSSGTSCSTED
ncbi:hypothetical protein HPB49_013982 [Dermacentor silvarum]|uniref:Uncharacterized protein n=1 Tax=Dermacentor silvarum TaxID=543639 RepID=A0ACB8E0R8_DERSI|nr:hypothetical protein HPB49_013982 [Dermacentor silvarum]